jgi:hypothetical protein
MYYRCKRLGRTNLWDLPPIALELSMQQLLHMLACAIDGITTSINQGQLMCETLTCSQ